MVSGSIRDAPQDHRRCTLRGSEWSFEWIFAQWGWREFLYLEQRHHQAASWSRVSWYKLRQNKAERAKLTRAFVYQHFLWLGAKNI